MSVIPTWPLLLAPSPEHTALPKLHPHHVAKSSNEALWPLNRSSIRLPNRSLTPIAVALTAFTINLAITGTRWYWGLSRGYDLGIFEQNAQTWWRLNPVSHYRGMPLLGDHFSPLLAVLAVPWHFAPSGLTLQITQSLLFASAVYLVVNYAQRQGLRGRRLAFVALSGITSFGFLSASARDVHEIEFGVPFIAGVCIAVLERRRAMLVACCLGLLLVKEDLGLTVVATAGVYFLRHCGWRFCCSLVFLGILGFVCALQVIGLTRGSGSMYLSYFGLAPQSAELAISCAGGIHPAQICRVLPFALFAITTGWWGLRSNITLIALPTLAWRVIASRGNYWVPLYHYDAILWPIGILAFVDAVRQTRNNKYSFHRTILIFCLVSNVCVSGLALWGRVAPWGSTTRFENMQRASRFLPIGSRIEADDATAAYFISRNDVYSLGDTKRPITALVFMPNGSRPGQPSECSKHRLLASLKEKGTVHAFGDVTVVTLNSGPMRVSFPACSGVR